MPIKLAINGFGRIGRAAFNIIQETHPEVEVVAINDLTDLEMLAHLLKYDTVYGQTNFSISVENDKLVVNGKNVNFYSEKIPPTYPGKN